MSATLIPPLPVSPRVRMTSSYTELMAKVRESGLLRRRYGYYWSRIAATVLAVAALGAGMVLLGNSWLQLILAGGLGVLLTQCGFLGHDAAHQQMFASKRWNDWAARILSGAFAGLSLTWWRTKHNRHHAAPNQEGRDPDVDSGALAFTAAIAAARSTGLRGWYTHHQGWFFFPLLIFEGLNLHVAGLRTLLGPGRTPMRLVEAAIVVTRLSAYVAFLLVLLPPGKAAAFVGVQMAVFGLCLGSAFAPNHTGMPIVAKDARIDFLQRQVLMSRNVRGGMLVSAAMGGLNYQIEHHLFPSMPTPNLKLVQPMVRAHCVKHGVPYAEAGAFEVFVIIIGYLNHVGLRARSPFDCPLAGQLRN